MKRLKELRKSKKLSQDMLGGIFEVGQKTISGWETGEREPDYQTITDVAAFFRVTPDYLMGYANTQMSNMVILTDFETQILYRNIDVSEKTGLEKMLQKKLTIRHKQEILKLITTFKAKNPELRIIYSDGEFISINKNRVRESKTFTGHKFLTGLDFMAEQTKENTQQLNKQLEQNKNRAKN
ncbi:hypothetical protein FACS1894202_07330 [Clostridia bacterium]|nr:hypothetical protein FACS1894202_07330 [Clostridia bacterium]